MNKESYVIAVGYPLGTVDFSDESLFTVQYHDKLYTLNEGIMHTWKTISKGATSTEVNVLDIIDEVDYLIGKKLAIAFDYKKPIKSYKKLSKYSLVRQGMNAIPQSGNYLIILGNSEIEVNLIEFKVWCQSDGIYSVKQIAKALESSLGPAICPDGRIAVVKAIISLAEKGLVFIERF